MVLRKDCHGVKDRSRAKKARLREDNKIVKSSPVWTCVDHFETRMKVVIERDGIEQTVSY